MDDLLKRISVNPKVMVGKPVIRETRLTVEFILGMLAHRDTIENILIEFLVWSKKISRPVCFLPAARCRTLTSCHFPSRDKCVFLLMNAPVLPLVSLLL